ncbi:DUF58 domain-containing protein [Paenibacillus sp. GCM10023252]|uniref:DUF58 domain-containing protein n=1 Tax=Paenibacillus sp. GCM10023252 TaxID=3252649 RepID=UPI00361F6F6C
MKSAAGKAKQAGYQTRWAAWTIIAAGWLTSVAAIVLRGGAAEWFLAVVLTGLILTSGWLPHAALRSVVLVHREISEEVAESGSSATIRLTVEQRLPWLVGWMVAEEELLSRSSMKPRSASLTVMHGLGMSKIWSLKYEVTELQRGLYEYEEIRITVLDWLGLTAVSKSLRCPGRLIVLPAVSVGSGGGSGSSPWIEQVEAPLSVASRYGASTAMRTGRELGYGADSRPYREGDSLRHINWKAAAKGIGLYTKEHGKELQVEALVAIDIDAASYGKDDGLFDACASLAGSALQEAADAGMRCRLLILSRERSTGLPVGAKQAAEETVVVTKLLQGSNDGVRGISLLLQELGTICPMDDSKAIVRNGAMQTYRLPRNSELVCYTADWQRSKSYESLAAEAAEQGSRVHLRIVVKDSQLTYAMREQQSKLERSGVLVSWVPYSQPLGTRLAGNEGGASHGQVQTV